MRAKPVVERCGSTPDYRCGHRGGAPLVVILSRPAVSLARLICARSTGIPARRFRASPNAPYGGAAVRLITNANWLLARLNRAGNVRLHCTSRGDAGYGGRVGSIRRPDRRCRDVGRSSSRFHRGHFHKLRRISGRNARSRSSQALSPSRMVRIYRFRSFGSCGASCACRKMVSSRMERIYCCGPFHHCIDLGHRRSLPLGEGHSINGADPRIKSSD